MGKLKNKVLWVIFGILTLFLVSILFIFNIQSYKSEEKSIESNLIRMNNDRNKVDIQRPEFNDKKDEMNPRIFMDSTVYVVILNENNQIEQVINHSQNTSISDEQIRNIAESIINKSKNGKVNIGNLYFEKYSYSLKGKNSIVIIDNEHSKDRLVSMLKTSILIFIILEIIIVCISYKLTNWIIKPVVDTFDKQKQFIADASHELKTPLAVIIANAEALENDPNEIKWLDNIKSEAERMNNLVSDLLDMAKSENNSKQQYQMENLSKLVERSLLTFESIIFEKNIKLDYKIEENINFNCNRNQIKQLVGILVDNAIKHSSGNGEILITLKKEKNSIVLNVKNKGEEISKENQEKIFERFYRADESRNRAENSYGLGLAIAKNIVEEYNGKIWVESFEGYNTFSVIFK